MDYGLTLGGVAALLVVFAAAGLITGFLSGLFGIGGGGVLVPVIYEAFGAVGIDPAIRMHLTIGTSLLVIVPTSLRTFAAQRARGSVDMTFLRRIAPWIVVGAIVGVVIAGAVPSVTLKAIWAVAGTLLALKMFLGRDDWRLGDTIPRSFWVEAYAVAVGMISTLMSIGGVAYIVALMTLYGRPLLASVATSSGVAPAVAIPGVIGFVIAGWGHPQLPPLSLGYVSLISAALVIPTSLFAAPIGVRLGHGLAKRTLELGFATFLLLVSVRFMLSLVIG